MQGRIRRVARRLAAAAGATLLAGAPAATSEELPVGYFTRHDSIGEVKISPEGGSFAVTAGRYGRETLLFLRRDDKRNTGGARAVEGNEIRSVDWISATRVVFTQAERRFGRAAPMSTGQIFAIDSDGGRSELLYGFRAGTERTGSRVHTREDSFASGELLSRLRGDEDRILILERPWIRGPRFLRSNPDAHPRIALLDIDNGRKRRIDTVPLSNATALVDRNDDVRFGIGPDENAALAVVWKPTPDSDWEGFELAGFREGSVVPRAFSADNGSVLLTGVREEESLNALYRLDLREGTTERLLRHSQADIENVVTGLTNDEVIGVRVYADKPEHLWLDEDHPDARLHLMLEQAFAGSTVSIRSATDDGRFAVVFVSSDVNPGDYYLFDTETRNAEYLYPARGWVDPALMRPKEPIALTARDGLVLHGYLTRPRPGDGPFPMIVLPHGGPYFVRDRWDYDWEVQLFASRGFAVLQVNFRGSEGYGLDFEAAGYGEWGAAMQDDLTDATRWAIDQRIADVDRICIVGTSYGGYAALMGIVREPRLYRCAVGHAGIYDLELMFETGDVPRSRTGRAFLEEILGTDPEQLLGRSPTRTADRIEVPVMLVHGENDFRADFQQAIRLKEALDAAGRDYEWLALGEEGHGIYDEETRESVYRKILDFLGRHLAER